MKISLRVKIILSYILLGIIGFVLISTFTFSHAEEKVISTRANSLYKEALTISNSYAKDYYNKILNLTDVQGLLSELDTYLGAQIWIVSPQGKILVNSHDASAYATEHTIDNFDITSFGNQYCQIGHFYDYFSDDQISVYAPITASYSVRGYVIIHLSVASVTEDVYSLLNTAYLTYILAMLVLLFFVLLYLFTSVRKIRRIQKCCSEYVQGTFTSRIDHYSSDEIGQIATLVDFMADQLENLEEDQRNFISNVSHDFRSPLTSLKGYVEAILDGTIPPEMQDKYLKIVLFEAERLTKLSQSLLDLNKVGSNRSRLDISTFDINNVIKTTAQTFEGTCLEKHISFHLTLTGEVLNVSADMSKIQQVLYNLIDNAIKFSNTDSTIDIDTSVKNEKVFVSVKDHGVGIPKENQSKIWERFFKSDSSRGKDKKGTGLGLAIVKGIIQAHGENIDVISTEGAGTEFIFTLQRVVL